MQSLPLPLIATRSYADCHRIIHRLNQIHLQRDISRTFTHILALKFIKLCFCQIPGVPFSWVSDVLIDWYIKPIFTTLPCINYNCSIRIYEAVAITENGKAEEWQHLFYMSVCLLCSVNIPSSLNWNLLIKIMNYISTKNKLWIDRIICNYNGNLSLSIRLFWNSEWNNG